MANAMEGKGILVSRTLARVFLVFPLLLTSCSLSSSAAQGKATLSIWYSTDDPVERTWTNELAAAFEASHPSIRVNLIDYSFEDLNTKLQLALSSGDPPDLAYVTPRGPGIPEYVRAHRLRNLSQAARKLGWYTRLRPSLLADYNRPFQFFGAKPNEIVAVPSSLAAVTILFNADVARQLHLSIPRSIAQFEKDLAKTKAAGYTPLGLGNGDGWLGDDWYLTLVNALVPPASLRGEQALRPSFSFNRQPFVKAATLLQSWANRGYFTHDFGGLDAQEGLGLFFRGRTLFQMISSSENAQILKDQQKTGLSVGTFAFPSANGGRITPISGYEGWIVPSASRHPTEAIAFLNEMLSPRVALILARHGLLPARAPQALPVSHVKEPAWQRQFFGSLSTSRAAVYLDAAPITNLNATMEANVQLLLQGYEGPQFLVKSLEDVYQSRGANGSNARIDGEF
jgi:raffinose/stachyose/melibiose transport system substrate-binding protein